MRDRGFFDALTIQLQQLGMVAQAIKLTAKSLGLKIDDDRLDIWECELAPDRHVAVMNAIRFLFAGVQAWTVSTGRYP